jgi:hypothetical protein
MRYRVILPFALTVGLASCGGKGAISSPTQPVRNYVHGLLAVGDDFANSQVKAGLPLPAAAQHCLRTPPSPQRNRCLAKVAKRLPPVGRPPAGSREVCGSLSSRARRQLLDLPNHLGAPVYASPLPSLLERTGYPPACPYVLRILNGIDPSVAANGVMDVLLASNSRSWSSIRITTLSNTGTIATIRVGNSRKTVPVQKIAGAWKIANLDFSTPGS